MNFPAHGIPINLQSELSTLPDNWLYVAANGRKAPLGDEWQQHPLTKQELFTALNNNVLPDKLRWKGNAIATHHIKAIGAFCGEKSGGLLFLDHDGDSCDGLIQKLSGLDLEDAIPDAPMVTSGKHGRYQLVYRIGERYWGAIATKKLKTGTNGPNGKPEQLEFRWNGCQSIVAGQHPETDGYTWITPPTEIPDAPHWMIEQMIVEHRPSTRIQHSEEEWAKDYLAHIPATDDYDDWIKVGQALHSVSDSLLWDWDKWSAQAQNYTAGECDKKWESFKFTPGRGLSIGYLGMLAKQNGWERPSFNDQQLPLTARLDASAIAPTHDRPRTTLQQTKISPEEKYTKFRQELTTALAIADPIQKEFILEELAINYRKSKKFMATAIAELEERRSPDKEPTKFSLTSILNREVKGTRYLIEDMVPLSESILLTAKPKVGKSLLAYEAAYAVASGSLFAGQFRAKKGKVLIIQTEEGMGEIQKRFIGRGFDFLDSDSVEVWTRWRWKTGMAELEEKLAEMRPSLVIVDSLRRIMTGSGLSENSAEFAQSVYELSDVTRQYGASMILIHHNNKQKGEDGKDLQGTDSVSGSAALTGAVWGTWQLTKTSTNPNDTNRHLNMTIRGDMGSRHSVDLVSGEGCSWGWEWRQEVNLDPGVLDWEKKILLALSQSSQELSLSDICNMYGLAPKDRQLYRPINRLINRGRVKVRRDERNKKLYWYSIPAVLDSPPSNAPQVFNQDRARVSIGTPPSDHPPIQVEDQPTPQGPSGNDQPSSVTPVGAEVNGQEGTPNCSTPQSEHESDPVGCSDYKPYTSEVEQIGSGQGGKCDQPQIAVVQEPPVTQSNGITQYRTNAKPRSPHRNPGILQSRPAEIGDVVKYGTSLTEWYVESIEGDRVLIKPTTPHSGASQVEVSLSEIQPLGHKHYEVF